MARYPLITWLAERAQITKQSMGYLVDHLETCGYVKRVPDPADGRAKLVRLTARGWKAHDLAFDIVRELEEEWAKALGPERLLELRNLLGDLGELVRRSNE